MLTVQIVSRPEKRGQFFREGTLSERIAAAVASVSEGWERLHVSDENGEMTEYFVSCGLAYKLSRSEQLAATSRGLAGDEPRPPRFAPQFPRDEVLDAAFRGLQKGNEPSWERVV